MLFLVLDLNAQTVEIEEATKTTLTIYDRVVETEKVGKVTFEVLGDHILYKDSLTEIEYQIKNSREERKHRIYLAEYDGIDYVIYLAKKDRFITTVAVNNSNLYYAYK